MTNSEESLMSMEHYVQKTFFKTASLMANSCQAVAILGGGDEAVSQVAYSYGRNLGLAFQVCTLLLPKIVMTCCMHLTCHDNLAQHCAALFLLRGIMHAPLSAACSLLVFASCEPSRACRCRCV